MYRLLTFSILIGVLQVLAAQDAEGDTSVYHWHSLFNGRDLEGWSVRCFEKDEQRNFWKVESGMLVCHSLGSTDHGYVWLQSKREYADFELRLKFSACRDHLGNSGIQVRSRWDPIAKVEPDHPGWMDGPQVDIEVGTPFRNGWIYDETREVKHWIDPVLPGWSISPEDVPERRIIHHWADEEPGWNDMRILCRGTRITTWVNNIRIAEYDGRGILDDDFHRRHEVGMKGHIAIQLHKHAENHLRFKDIEIRELPAN